MKNKKILAAVATGIIAAAGALRYIEADQATAILRLLGLL